MIRLYADENFPRAVVLELRLLGHDVLTAHEAGQANQHIPDPDVLAFACKLGRAVITNNRWHFVRLHRTTPSHEGIVVCKEDQDFIALAQRIHQVLTQGADSVNKLIRIRKPPNP
jgi:hypothetical protein